MNDRCFGRRRAGAWTATLLLAIALAGTSGCAGTEGEPNRFTQTLGAMRTSLAQYRPEFLSLKSSTDLGYRALTTQDYEKAAWHLEFEVENKPQDPAPRLYLGQVYAATGRMAQAQEMFRAAVELGGTAPVERDSATLGRTIAEVAAERLAALGVPPGPALAAGAGTTESDDLENAEVGAVMATTPAIEPVGPAPDTMPETVIITGAPPPVETPAAPRTIEATAPEPTAAIHLASYKRRDRADRGWDILTHDYPELRGLVPTVVEADLGPKGIYYRLVAEGLHSADEARKLCRTIKAHGHDWCQIGQVSR